jgi:hypothetical protein
MLFRWMLLPRNTSNTRPNGRLLFFARSWFERRDSVWALLMSEYPVSVVLKVSRHDHHPYLATHPADAS